MNIPLYKLLECYEYKLKDKNKIIVIYCQSGIRSKKAIKILFKKGFKNLYNLKGGLDEI
ncbi:MAG: rhodanese-like domain-containing protein [Clostridia bacterium]|nr:rhodanese-like domain-containing protein [Clostridia bacterium]